MRLTQDLVLVSRNLYFVISCDDFPNPRLENLKNDDIYRNISFKKMEEILCIQDNLDSLFEYDCRME